MQHYKHFHNEEHDVYTRLTYTKIPKNVVYENIKYSTIGETKFWQWLTSLVNQPIASKTVKLYRIFSNNWIHGDPSVGFVSDTILVDTATSA